MTKNVFQKAELCMLDWLGSYFYYGLVPMTGGWEPRTDKQTPSRELVGKNIDALNAKALILLSQDPGIHQLGEITVCNVDKWVFVTFR